jgi:hypothetical protein
MTSASNEEWHDFNSFFQSRKQVVVRWGRIRIIGWEIKTLKAESAQFLLGCQCPVTRGIVVQEQDTFGEFTAALLLQTVLQLHQQRQATLRVDSLALSKIINEENAVMIPKNRGENFSSVFVISEYLGVSRYAATPLIVALSPAHSAITRFRPLSPIAPDRISIL